jgi:hypothetical protein
MRYQFWKHSKTGEVYAVRIDKDGIVTGAVGPMHYLDRKDEDLPYYEYDDDPEDGEWMQRNKDNFLLY